MCKLTALLVTTLTMSAVATAAQHFEITIDSSRYGSCATSKWHGSDFLSNIGREFCLYESKLQPEGTDSNIVKNIVDYIRDKVPALRTSDLIAESVYFIPELKDVYYFHIVDEEYWHNRLDVLFNKRSGETFILQAMTIEELNTLLGDHELNDAADYDLLRHCRLITLLLYPHVPIRFVSSMNEVYMVAVYRPFSMFNLEDAKYTPGITIELPRIERNEVTVTVSFTIMKGAKLVRLSMIFERLRLKKVNEAEIGEFRDWLGIE
jgi:hypothetical protein